MTLVVDVAELEPLAPTLAPLRFTFAEPEALPLPDVEDAAPVEPVLPLVVLPLTALPTLPPALTLPDAEVELARSRVPPTVPLAPLAAPLMAPLARVAVPFALFAAPLTVPFA